MRISQPPRFLLDENLSPEIALGVVQHNKDIDILYVRGPGAPPEHTPDADILEFCERERRVLITNNRRSMPGEVARFFEAGHHHWGIFKIKDEARMADLIDQIVLIWGASDADEYIDRELWIPE